METTLNKIKEHDPCGDGWDKLLVSLNKTEADDEPLTFLHILNSNGLEDCIWAMRSAPQYDREWRLFCIWCARQVQHLMTDERSINALDIAERFANGEASSEELAAAGDAARAVARAAGAAAWAAWAAAWAAAEDASWSASWAARDSRAASWAATRAASLAAAWAAALADRDAAWAARDASWAARDATGDAQINYLITLFTK